MVGQRDLHDIWTWNATVPQTVEACVHEAIADTTRRQPDAKAICAWDGKLSYGELDELSTRLAYHLICLGIGSEAIVPLCFEKSMRTPVAMLAVMKAGGASIALDISQPEERLRTIVQQVRPVLILSSLASLELADRLTDLSVPVVTVDARNLARLGPMVGAELPAVSPSGRLYVVYTSGSTGTPKGVVITHTNFSSAIRHQQHLLGIDASSRVYDFASYAFDVAWSNFLHTLTSGGCLCVPSAWSSKNDLASSVQVLRANHLDLTPRVAELLPPETMLGLRTLVVGGEPMDLHHARLWRKSTNTKNAYGPSETTPTATIHDLNDDPGEPYSIGKGAGLCTWVTHPQDYKQLVQIGDIGELLLEGPLVGAGYLFESEKAAAAFIEDPPWLSDGGPGHPGRRGRLYRTGDLVRYNLDGRLTFVGRKDTQVKIRGQRIELAEVEHHVRNSVAHFGDVQVVVEIIAPRNSSNTVLAAFLSIGEAHNHCLKVPQAAFGPIVAESKDRLATQLPVYMIPTTYIPLSEIPMTISGKIDRQRLRELGSTHLHQYLNRTESKQAASQPPCSTIELKLQQLWSTALGLERSQIRADHSFLQLGGDSITAMLLVRMINETFRSRISVEWFIHQKNLTTLAQGIVDLRGHSSCSMTSLLDLLEDLRNLSKNYISPKSLKLEKPLRLPQRIFLTGANGYLGSVLLHQVLQLQHCPQISVLVRARSVEHAEERIIRSAKFAGWWNGSYQHRISYWLGDLREPRLGLSDVHWRNLSGLERQHECTDSVLHYGASVDWYRDYFSLRDANVISTHQLLNLASTSPYLTRYLYVSAANQLDSHGGGEGEAALRQELDQRGGYGQSKLIAEHLLSRTRFQQQHSNCRIVILKPAFIIGNAVTGIANGDDFLWRVVAGCVSIGCFPLEPEGS